MRTSTSVMLLLTGAILAFAVHGDPPYLDLQLAGLIVMAAGVARLWLRSGSDWVREGGEMLRTLLDESAPRPAGEIRVPLEELMAAGCPDARPDARPDVWAAQEGHEEQVRVHAAAPEVTKDGHASNPTQAW
jgi:hypothetical protein